MWKNTAEPDRPQMTILYGVERMGFACRITTASVQTHTQNM